MKNKKVVCIDNDFTMNLLTVGKVYKVKQEWKGNGYLIERDDGVEEWFRVDRFIPFIKYVTCTSRNMFLTNGLKYEVIDETGNCYKIIDDTGEPNWFNKSLFDGTKKTNDAYEKLKEFEEMCRPLMKWLNENRHPHHMIMITPSRAKILEATSSTGEITDYIPN